MEQLQLGHHPNVPLRIYKVVIVGTGNATFLGNYNLEMWFCLNPYNGDNLDCYGVVTAANGDKFYTLMTDSNH